MKRNDYEDTSETHIKALNVREHVLEKHRITNISKKTLDKHKKGFQENIKTTNISGRISDKFKKVM